MIDLQKISNSTVIVRVCDDVSSLDKLDRVQDSAPTIKILLSNNNKVLILSHWGRPKGNVDNSKSLKLLQPATSQFLQTKVEFMNQYEGFEAAKNKINKSENKVFLLENTRFSPFEKSKIQSERDSLARQYASLADFFVDEAFAVSHRKEVTNFELSKLLPKALGLSYQNEIENLNKLSKNPVQPFVVVMAGAKLETKLPLIEKMLVHSDKVLLGGMLSFVFVKAAQDLGLTKYETTGLFDSPVELDFYDKAKEILLKYSEKLFLPLDFVYGNKDDKKVAYDVGEQTINEFKVELQSAKTIFWNGTLGYYEQKPFDKGTEELAEYITTLTSAFKAIGGGDTNSALPQKILEKFDFVSMGGGATLDYLGR
ncbi:MAG: phosphoglycerate kinase [bacterium]